jgi:hypothetical protein
MVVFPFDKLLEVIVTRGQWVLVLVVLDVLMGVLSALKAKEFKWDKLADFLTTYGIKVIGWLTLEAIALLPADALKLAGFTVAIATSAYAALLLSAVGSILGNVKKFLPDAFASGMGRAGL